VGDFLEQIKRAKEAAERPTPEPGQTKPPDEMTDAELEEAITASRRKLLDLQHQELRQRELARVSGAGEATERPRASGLAEVLGNLQKRKRRTWR
jgi:hypothetical protein